MKNHSPFHQLLLGDGRLLGVPEGFLPGCELARGSDEGAIDPMLYVDGAASVVCGFFGWQK
jgi:hypothetical protein